MRTEVFDCKSALSWDKIKDRVAAIERACFGENAYTAEQLATDFNWRTHVSVLLWDDMLGVDFEYLIGYTQAAQDPDYSEVWGVENTAIDPKWQHRGLVANMMATLYVALRDRGCEFIERDAAVENGYADKLSALHAADIIEQHDHDSKYGRQRFMRMRIPRA